MDNYRRRPPMEGFSRPGELGGEAFDDDSVEGHIMDERDDNPDTSFRRKVDENPGETNMRRRLDEDDTEGHKLTARGAVDDDDTEGHKLTARGAVDDDDTEGHSLTKRS
jgi:hypothetical protein